MKKWTSEDLYCRKNTDNLEELKKLDSDLSTALAAAPEQITEIANKASTMRFTIANEDLPQVVENASKIASIDLISGIVTLTEVSGYTFLVGKGGYQTKRIGIYPSSTASEASNVILTFSGVKALVDNIFN